MAYLTVTPESWISTIEGDKIISKPAETLSENDTILGARGGISKLSDRAKFGQTPCATIFYGINDHPAFFCAGQPLWTNGGWKAIDPEMAKKENPWLDVSRLSVGDYIYRLNTETTAPGKVEYDKIKIKSFSSRTISQGSPKLNLHCREGARSFHANGFLLANNYPEVTATRTAKNINRLSLKEKNKIIKNLHKAKPLIKNTFGFDALPFIRSKLDSDDSFLTSAIKGDNTPKTHPKALVAVDRYRHVYIFGYKLIDFTGKSGEKSISFVDGRVFVDGCMAEWSHIERNLVSWRRRLDGGKQEHGVMKLHAEGLSGDGVISVTDGEEKVDKECQASEKEGVAVFKAAATLRYKCTHSPSVPEFPFMIEIGLKLGEDGELNLVSRLLYEDTQNEVVGSFVSLHHSDGKLAADIHFGSNGWLFGWNSGTITWSWDYQTFDGAIYEYDSSTVGNLGAKHTLHGQYITSSSEASLIETAASTPHPCLHIGTHTRDISLTNHLMRSNSLVQFLPRTVQELAAIPPPDDAVLHELSQEKIFSWMKYHMEDEWMDNILGEVKPQISDSDKETIEQAEIKRFLQDMGKAYLVKGLQGVKSLEENFNTDEKNKALYYWAGSGDTSVGMNPNYNTLSNLSARQAFGDLVDGTFQKYLDGEGGQTPEQWGEALYNYLISDDMFPGLCAGSLGGNHTRLNSYCMMLYLLAPEKNYATELNKKVLFGNVMKYFSDMSTEQREEAKEFIYDALHDLIVSIINDTTGLYPNLQQEIAEAMQEAGFEQGQMDAEMIEQYILNMQTVIVDLIDIIIGNQSMSVTERMKQFSDALNTWEAQNPKWSKGLKMLGHVMSLATIGYGMYNIIEGFINWDELPWQQKMQLIIDFVQNLGEVANITMEVIDVFRKPGVTVPEMKQVMAEFDGALNSPETVDSVGEFAREQSPELDAALSEVDEAGLGRIGEVASADAAEVSRFEKLMNWTKKMCKALNVLALAAACVGIGFQIKNDFATNQPAIVKACDILQAVGLVFQLGIEIAGFFFESAVLPVIGIVVAIVGVVLMIISMIFHKKPPKPETPAEKFINQHGKPFLEKLDKPSQDWMDDYDTNHPDEETVLTCN